MTRPARFAFTGAAVAAVLVVLSAPTTAWAQSSGGTGGPVGSQDSWPCPGCLFGTPDGYDAGRPAPLLVTFHGDEGHPTYIHRSYYGSDRGPGPARTRGFLVLSLQCPVALGCADADPEGDPSWWRWRSSDFYDPEWVGLQVDAVQAAYDVSLRQIYMASFSGGSSFSRRYAFEQADRFAGALISGGGGVPTGDGCFDTCKIPIFISIGSLDELYDLAQGTRQYAEACGHELFYSEHAGIGHTIIEEDLPVALDWFLERPHPCIASETPPSGSAGSPGTAGGGSLSPDSGIASGSGGASGVSGAAGLAGSSGSAPVGSSGGTATGPVGAGPTESPSDITDMYADHMNRTTSSDADSCGCRVRSRGGGRTGAAILVGLAAVLMRRRRSVR